MLKTNKISFALSLKYYLKNRTIYKRFDCHTNAYVKFYDDNYDIVDKRPSDFAYCTGLLCFNHNGKKECYVHSWVEDRGMIIDTTMIANSNLAVLEKIDDSNIEEIKNLSEEAVYIIYSKLKNNDFNKLCIKISSKFAKDNYIKAVNEELIKISNAVEKDINFLESVKRKFGYNFTNNIKEPIG